MQLKSGTYVDARKKGSLFRFINHSCRPNCTVEMWTVNKRIRVGVFSISDISAGTELNFDYKWKRSNRLLTKCHCGTDVCRGYIEIVTPDEIAQVILLVTVSLFLLTFYYHHSAH